MKTLEPFCKSFSISSPEGTVAEPRATMESYLYTQALRDLLQQGGLYMPMDEVVSTSNGSVHSRPDKRRSRVRYIDSGLFSRIVSEKNWKEINSEIIPCTKLPQNGYEHFMLDRSETIRVLKYEKGDFFDWHRDAMKSKNHVGTLIFLPPATFSAYEGGDLLVTIEEKIHTFRQHADKMSVVVLWGDPPHRVDEVKEGCRYSIVVHLLLKEESYFLLERPPQFLQFDVENVRRGVPHNVRYEVDFSLEGEKEGDLETKLQGSIAEVKKIIDYLTHAMEGIGYNKNVKRVIELIRKRNDRRCTPTERGFCIPLRNYYRTAPSIVEGIDYSLFRELKELFPQRDFSWSICNDTVDIATEFSEESESYEEEQEIKKAQLLAGRMHYEWTSSADLEMKLGALGIDLFVMDLEGPIGVVLPETRYDTFNDTYYTYYDSVAISMLHIKPKE